MSKRENGEGSIYYDKSRSKYVASLVDPNGKRIAKRFTDRNEARAWLSNIKGEIATQVYIPATNITLGDWIIEWLRTFKTNIKPKTKLQYIQTSAHIEPIANIPLQAMTAAIAQKLLNELPKDMASSSKKKVYQLLFASTKKAYNLDMIRKNFMEPVEPPSVKQKEVEIFTAEEMKKILHYVHYDAPDNLRRHYPLILLAATSGARIGELLALKWQDVDYNNARIHIQANLQYIPGAGQQEMEPKTVAGNRYITIPIGVLETLGGRRTPQGKIIRMIRPEDYVFVTKRGTPFMSRNIGHYWKDILKGAEVPYKNFHVLRHTHATRLLAEGIPILEVAKRLGHSKASHTLNLYGHCIPNKDQEVAKKVALIYAVS